MLFGAEHVRRYVETDGKEGHDWVRGTSVLILTTTGRSTGVARTHPLIYREDAGTYVVVASNGGDDEHPHWYRNLQTEPHAEVQVWGDRIPVTAHTATADEKARLWQLMNEVWPDYDRYQAKTSREIPVVVLERR